MRKVSHGVAGGHYLGKLTDGSRRFMIKGRDATQDGVPAAFSTRGPKPLLDPASILYSMGLNDHEFRPCLRVIGFFPPPGEQLR